jgi:phosphoserine phosphatase
MTTDSPIVAEVRQRAMEISARFGHDLDKYAAHLKEIERQHSDRVVSQVTVVRPASAAEAVKP